MRWSWLGREVNGPFVPEPFQVDAVWFDERGTAWRVTDRFGLATAPDLLQFECMEGDGCRVLTPSDLAGWMWVRIE